MARLFIHATNIHQGGGKALLEALLGTCSTQEEWVLLLDARMSISSEMLGGSQIIRVKPTILHRLWAEWRLARLVREGDTVLCFGNLPPLFKLAGRAAVFVQNRYLVDKVGLADFPIKTRLRLRLERLWFSLKMDNADMFIVQTPTMRELLSLRFGKRDARPPLSPRAKMRIQVLPFVKGVDGYERRLQERESWETKDFDFFYVASGEPHKNHRCLIEAWCLLAESGQFPSLGLTLDRVHFAELCDWIEKKKARYGLNLENLGVVPHDQVKQLYKRAGALIYPSTFESFGLPLIEARQAGLPVLASELDYVRDVLDPEQSFDPESATSIARAVKRFMGLAESSLPLLDAVEFMNCIFEEAK